MMFSKNALDNTELPPYLRSRSGGKTGQAPSSGHADVRQEGPQYGTAIPNANLRPQPQYGADALVFLESLEPPSHVEPPRPTRTVLMAPAQFPTPAEQSPAPVCGVCQVRPDPDQQGICRLCYLQALRSHGPVVVQPGVLQEPHPNVRDMVLSIFEKIERLKRMPGTNGIARHELARSVKVVMDRHPSFRELYGFLGGWANGSQTGLDDVRLSADHQVIESARTTALSVMNAIGCKYDVRVEMPGAQVVQIVDVLLPAQADHLLESTLELVSAFKLAARTAGHLAYQRREAKRRAAAASAAGASPQSGGGGSRQLKPKERDRAGDEQAKAAEENAVVNGIKEQFKHVYASVYQASSDNNYSNALASALCIGEALDSAIDITTITSAAGGARGVALVYHACNLFYLATDRHADDFMSSDAVIRLSGDLNSGELQGRIAQYSQLSGSHGEWTMSDDVNFRKQPAPQVQQGLAQLEQAQRAAIDELKTVALSQERVEQAIVASESKEETAVAAAVQELKQAESVVGAAGDAVAASARALDTTSRNVTDTVSRSVAQLQAAADGGAQAMERAAQGVNAVSGAISGLSSSVQQAATVAESTANTVARVSEIASGASSTVSSATSLLNTLEATVASVGPMVAALEGAASTLSAMSSVSNIIGNVLDSGRLANIADNAAGARADASYVRRMLMEDEQGVRSAPLVALKDKIDAQSANVSSIATTVNELKGALATVTATQERMMAMLSDVASAVAALGSGALQPSVPPRPPAPGGSESGYTPVPLFPNEGPLPASTPPSTPVLMAKPVLRFDTREEAIAAGWRRSQLLVQHGSYVPMFGGLRGGSDGLGMPAASSVALLSAGSAATEQQFELRAGRVPEVVAEFTDLFKNILDDCAKRTVGGVQPDRLSFSMVGPNGTVIKDYATAIRKNFVCTGYRAGYTANQGFDLQSLGRADPMPLVFTRSRAAAEATKRATLRVVQQLDSVSLPDEIQQYALGFTSMAQQTGASIGGNAALATSSQATAQRALVANTSRLELSSIRANVAAKLATNILANGFPFDDPAQLIANAMSLVVNPARDRLPGFVSFLGKRGLDAGILLSRNAIDGFAVARAPNIEIYRADLTDVAAMAGRDGASGSFSASFGPANAERTWSLTDPDVAWIPIDCFNANGATYAVTEFFLQWHFAWERGGGNIVNPPAKLVLVDTREYSQETKVESIDIIWPGEGRKTITTAARIYLGMNAAPVIARTPRTYDLSVAEATEWLEVTATKVSESIFATGVARFVTNLYTVPVEAGRVVGPAIAGTSECQAAMEMPDNPADCKWVDFQPVVTSSEDIVDEPVITWDNTDPEPVRPAVPGEGLGIIEVDANSCPLHILRWENDSKFSLVFTIEDEKATSNSQGTEYVVSARHRLPAVGRAQPLRRYLAGYFGALAATKTNLVPAVQLFRSDLGLARQIWSFAALQQVAGLEQLCATDKTTPWQLVQVEYRNTIAMADTNWGDQPASWLMRAYNVRVSLSPHWAHACGTMFGGTLGGYATSWVYMLEPFKNLPDGIYRPWSVLPANVWASLVPDALPQPGARAVKTAASAEGAKRQRWKAYMFEEGLPKRPDFTKLLAAPRQADKVIAATPFAANVAAAAPFNGLVWSYELKWLLMDTTPKLLSYLLTNPFHVIFASRSPIGSWSRRVGLAISVGPSSSDGWDGIWQDLGRKGMPEITVPPATIGVDTVFTSLWPSDKYYAALQLTKEAQDLKQHIAALATENGNGGWWLPE